MQRDQSRGRVKSQSDGDDDDDDGGGLRHSEFPLLTT